MPILDNNADNLALPPIDPLNAAEKPEDAAEPEDYGIFGGVVRFLKNALPTVAIVVIGLALLILAFVVTDVGKNAIKKGVE